MLNKKEIAIKFNKLFLVMSDMAVLFLSVFIAYYISTPDDFSLNINEIRDSVIRLNLFLLSALGVVAWLWTVYRHYTYRKPFWDELREIYITLFVTALLNLFFLVSTRNNFSIYTWAYVWGFPFILFPFGRILSKRCLQLLDLWKIDCVIIGNGENARAAYRAISNDNYLGYSIKAFIASSGTIPITFPNEIGYISEDTLLENIAKYKKVFIALEKEQTDLVEGWIRKLNRHGFRNISVVPSLSGIPLYGAEISHFFSYEAIVLRIQNNLAKRSSRIIKRTFDIVLSAVFLVLFSPLFAYLFFKIRQDGGSATYSQIRVGRNGKVFHCYKFRTMVMNSSEVLKQLLETDMDAKREWEKSFKLKNDPRVTAIGRFLRKTSLDELPQLWNVLKGEMSLVGPRPIIRQELRFYGDDTVYYYMVRPGLTGLWQISGRSDTDYVTRVYLDSWYVKNWSLWNDITILAKTTNVVVKGKGAY